VTVGAGQTDHSKLEVDHEAAVLFRSNRGPSAGRG